jgi:hypothetical protein
VTVARNDAEADQRYAYSSRTSLVRLSRASLPLDITPMSVPFPKVPLPVVVMRSSPVLRL